MKSALKAILAVAILGFSLAYWHFFGLYLRVTNESERQIDRFYCETGSGESWDFGRLVGGEIKRHVITLSSGASLTCVVERNGKVLTDVLVVGYFDEYTKGVEVVIKEGDGRVSATVGRI